MLKFFANLAPCVLALEACAESAEAGSDLEAQVRLAKRHVARATRIPTALAKRTAAPKQWPSR